MKETSMTEYPEHNNDIGDWCPWSGERRQNPDSLCPAGCASSRRTHKETQ